MPFNKQKYRVTSKERDELSADTIRELDKLSMKVARVSNITIKTELDPKTFDTVITIGKRTETHA